MRFFVGFETQDLNGFIVPRSFGFEDGGGGRIPDSLSLSAGLDTTAQDRKVLVWSSDPNIRLRAPLAGLGVANMYHLLCDV